MPERFQRQRTKGWRKPEGGIFVDRTTPFGNPWKVNAPGGFWLPTYNVSGSKIGRVLTNTDAAYLFMRGMDGCWFDAWMLPATLTNFGRAEVRKLLRAHFDHINANLHTLRSHDLGCWCGIGEDCHAHVLLDLANGTP